MKPFVGWLATDVNAAIGLQADKKRQLNLSATCYTKISPTQQGACDGCGMPTKSQLGGVMPSSDPAILKTTSEINT